MEFGRREQIGIISFLAVAGLAFIPYADVQAQSNQITNTTVMHEQYVMEVVNGTLSVTNRTVPAVWVTYPEPSFVPPPPPTEPWHIQSGYDSKILPFLQKVVDAGYDPVEVAIHFDPITYWPDGYPSGKPTREQIKIRNAEIAAETEPIIRPIISLINASNGTVTFISDTGFITATVPVSLLPELELLESVTFMNDGRDNNVPFLLESRSITGIEQMKHAGHDGTGAVIGVVDGGIDSRRLAPF